MTTHEKKTRAEAVREYVNNMPHEADCAIVHYPSRSDMPCTCVRGMMSAALGDPSKDAQLTDRERDVLGLIAKGASNKAIAAALFISENTVRAHVRSLMQKTQTDNRTELAVWALTNAGALRLVPEADD